MTTPRLIFDCHLDLSMNAMECNRDLRWSLEKIRRCELSRTASPRTTAERASTRNTVCLPEMRRGRIGVCVATQIARYSPRFQQAARLEQSRAGLGADAGAARLVSRHGRMRRDGATPHLARGRGACRSLARGD